ncbi:OmpP1/FadL family transporter [Pedobacter antarcticus]|uniref:Long-chain fatty acid transporter n=2 Tax=Pedobacter antarcticus TaxID=34086 RepID=A0A081PLC7_9SPHI|nr:outer membrane protein transport protein [Pedobacter antarcticus]KEQ31500.1 long-chain fatty acid transporter [Pedobacter antarcticus 4BY]SDM01116.1 long-chain fatty acid transport protein [Pedobacter antarcticus]SFF31244.1 long-chain fatty acid transport protein [Pedobacter antarcticus]
MKKILLSVLLVLPVLGFAQSFQVNLQGQKQTAMGGAGTGVAMDEAAVFFNPGAVSFLEKNGVQAGISPLYLKTAFRENGSNITEYNKDKIATPIMGYAVFGNPQGRIRFGLGIYTPFGGAMHWKEDWTGKYAITSLDLQAIYVQPTISIKITDQIGIGGGLVYSMGKVDLRRAVPLTLNDGRQGDVKLKGDSHDFGWNAGIYIKTISGVSIGITHRSQVTANVKDGDATFNVPDALRSSFPTKFSAALPLPATTSIGLGFYPSAKTTIAVDANWVHWNKYKELAFIYNNNDRIENTVSPRNYHDAAALRVGIENQATSKLALRAGVGYAFTPVGKGYVTPEVPDANRILLSAGLGYKASERFQIDFSFLYENVKARNETNIETGLSGEFKTVAYIPGISLSYKW